MLISRQISDLANTNHFSTTREPGQANQGALPGCADSSGNWERVKTPQHLLLCVRTGQAASPQRHHTAPPSTPDALKKSDEISYLSVLYLIEADTTP